MSSVAQTDTFSLANCNCKEMPFSCTPFLVKRVVLSSLPFPVEGLNSAAECLLTHMAGPACSHENSLLFPVGVAGVSQDTG